MRQGRVIISAAALIGLAITTGCQKEIEAQDGEMNLREMTFHAGWADETKTVLQEDGKSIYWAPEDEISVFVGSGDQGGNKFKSNNDVVSASVKFVGELPEQEQDPVTYFALYPYDTQASCSDEHIYSSVPAIQYAKAGDFAPGQLISVAKTDGEDLFFYNVCGGIKFSVAGEGINKIVFKTDNLYTICGSLNVCFDSNNAPSIDFSDRDSRNDEITVYPLDTGCFTPEKSYYVSMLPQTMLTGLEIQFFKGDSLATYNCDMGWGYKSIERSKFKRLLNKDAGLKYVSLDGKFAKIFGNGMWPFNSNASAGIRQTITEVNFYTSCETLKGSPIERTMDQAGFSPVYVELDGTIVNFYTKAERYLIDDYVSFDEMSNLEELDLSMIDTRNVKDFYMMFMDCESLKKVNLTGWDTSHGTDFGHMFYNCRSLEELDLSSFDISNMRGMYDMFCLCTNLKSVNLCNASAGNMSGNNAGNLFYNCKKLTKIDLGNLDLSNADCSGAMLRVAKLSNNCAILCTPETKARLCKSDTRIPSDDNVFAWYTPGDVLPDVEPRKKPDLYYSTDFSMDQKVKQLNKATEGAGIDIVFVGEAYSDRLIDSGTYESDVTTAMEDIFSVEPFASFRQYFNVYMVYAVSTNEVYDEDTAFDYYNEEINNTSARYEENGLYAEMDIMRLSRYSQLALKNDNPKHLTRVIIVHQDGFHGCASIHPLCDDGVESPHDTPTGVDGIAIVHRCASDDIFKYLVCHEFGHAFAALFEEYVDRYGTIPEMPYSQGGTWDMQRMLNHGWYSNIDFTSDPETIKWHSFLQDSRYDESVVSIIEGARYSSGIWRSEDDNIMGSTIDHYSVPAREAIYKVINKLAYGDSWQYDYETFVQQDLKNIRTESSAVKSSIITVPFRTPRMNVKQSTTHHDGKTIVTVTMN